MEYYSDIKKNKFESMEVRWVNLEAVMQSEVSQKEKNKYCTLIHIYAIQKNSTDEPICREEMEMQTQKTDFWTEWGKRGQDELKNVALTCIHYHV